MKPRSDNLMEVVIPSKRGKPFEEIVREAKPTTLEVGNHSYVRSGRSVGG